MNRLPVKMTFKTTILSDELTFGCKSCQLNLNLSSNFVGCSTEQSLNIRNTNNDLLLIKHLFSSTSFIIQKVRHRARNTQRMQIILHTFNCNIISYLQCNMEHCNYKNIITRLRMFTPVCAPNLQTQELNRNSFPRLVLFHRREKHNRNMIKLVAISFCFSTFQSRDIRSSIIIMRRSFLATVSSLLDSVALK